MNKYINKWAIFKESVREHMLHHQMKCVLRTGSEIDRRQANLV